MSKFQSIILATGFFLLAGVFIVTALQFIERHDNSKQEVKQIYNEEKLLIRIDSIVGARQDQYIDSVKNEIQTLQKDVQKLEKINSKLNQQNEKLDRIYRSISPQLPEF